MRLSLLEYVLTGRGAWLVVLLSLVVYLPAFDNGFRQDDFVFFEDAGRIEAVTDLVTPSADFAFYRPGARALFYLERQLFGGRTGLYIVFNYLLFVLTALAFRRLLSAFDERPVIVWLAPLLFLLGVGHFGKQVMWAAASGPLASMLLSVVGLVAFVSARFGRTRHRGGQAAMFVTCAVLAPACHEVGLVLPVVAAAVMLYMRPPDPARKTLALGVVVAVLWVVAYRLSGFETYSRPPDVARIANGMFHYLGLAVVPIQSVGANAARAELAPFLPVAIALRAMAGTMLLGILVYAIAWIRGQTGLAALWTICLLAPFTIIPLPAGWWEVRYLYPMALPLSWLFARGGVYLTGSTRRVKRWAGIVAAVYLVATALTVTRLLEMKGDAQSRPVVESTTETMRGDG